MAATPKRNSRDFWTFNRIAVTIVSTAIVAIIIAVILVQPYLSSEEYLRNYCTRTWTKNLIIFDADMDSDCQRFYDIVVNKYEWDITTNQLGIVLQK